MVGVSSYILVLFTSGRIKQKKNQWTRVSSTVTKALLQSVAVKNAKLVMQVVEKWAFLDWLGSVSKMRWGAHRELGAEPWLLCFEQSQQWVVVQASDLMPPGHIPPGQDPGLPAEPELAEGFCILTGLGASWDTAGGAGERHWGEGCLCLPPGPLCPNSGKTAENRWRTQTFDNSIRKNQNRQNKQYATVSEQLCPHTASKNNLLKHHQLILKHLLFSPKSLVLIYSS